MLLKINKSNALYNVLVEKTSLSKREAPVTLSVERWTCEIKAASSNPGLEGLRETIP